MGDSLLSIPQGAVQTKQEISALFRFDMNFMPPCGTVRDTFVFSPMLVLEPHNLPFKVPVKIRFPFTARQGWTLKLMREDPVRGWIAMSTMDTDTHEQMSLDTHCKFNADTALLELGHFCKYLWCGRKKEKALSSEKELGCSLYGRMNQSGNNCEFFLYLTDQCNDAYNVSANTKIIILSPVCVRIICKNLRCDMTSGMIKPLVCNVTCALYSILLMSCHVLGNRKTLYAFGVTYQEKRS